MNIRITDENERRKEAEKLCQKIDKIQVQEEQLKQQMTFNLEKHISNVLNIDQNSGKMDCAKAIANGCT